MSAPTIGFGQAKPMFSALAPAPPPAPAHHHHHTPHHDNTDARAPPDYHHKHKKHPHHQQVEEIEQVEQQRSQDATKPISSTALAHSRAEKLVTGLLFLLFVVFLILYLVSVLSSSSSSSSSSGGGSGQGGLPSSSTGGSLPQSGPVYPQAPEAVINGIGVTPLSYSQSTPLFPNGTTRSPRLSSALGWNSWESFHFDLNETEYRGVVQAIVSTGMAAAGYRLAVIDDRWECATATSDSSAMPVTLVDSYGRAQPDPVKFPSSVGTNNAMLGFQPLISWVHSQNLQFGIHIINGMNAPGYNGNYAFPGSSQTTQQIVLGTSSGYQCSWCPSPYTMYYLDPSNANAQTWVNLQFAQYAQWGVGEKIYTLQLHPASIEPVLTPLSHWLCQTSSKSIVYGGLSHSDTIAFCCARSLADSSPRRVLAFLRWNYGAGSVTQTQMASIANMYHTAALASGRPIAIEFSPGAVPGSTGSVPAQVQQGSSIAQAYRMQVDMWPESGNGGTLLYSTTGSGWSMLNVLSTFVPLMTEQGHVITGTNDMSFGDLDMIEVGGPVNMNNDFYIPNAPTLFTNPQLQTIFATWAMVRSPIVIGGDVRYPIAAQMAMILNADMLFVNQYSGNLSVKSNDGSGNVKLWAQRQDLGLYWIMHSNMANSVVAATTSATDASGSFSTCTMKDIWGNVTQAAVASMTVQMPAYGCSFVRLSGCS
jgi:hypothetical protein